MQVDYSDLTAYGRDQVSKHWRVDGGIELLTGQLDPGKVRTGDTACAYVNGDRWMLQAIVVPLGIQWRHLCKATKDLQTFFELTAGEVLDIRRMSKQRGAF